MSTLDPQCNCSIGGPEPDCPIHGQNPVNPGAGIIGVNGNLYCSLCNPENAEVAPPMMCEHVSKCILENADAEWINPSDDLSVPVFPDANVWAQVLLVPIPNESDIAKIKLVYEDDLTIDRSVMLGLWTRGEGRLSIRAAILEHIRSKVDPREDFTSHTIWTQCPSSTHGFPQIQAMQHNSEVWFKQACMWFIAMEEACLPCVENTLSNQPDHDPKNDTRHGAVNPVPSSIPQGVPVTQNAIGQMQEAKQGDNVVGISLGDGQVMVSGQTLEFKTADILISNDDKEKKRLEKFQKQVAAYREGIHFA